MLSVEEFIPGTLSKAEPLTLLLPRHEHERAMLVVPGEGAPTVVMLSASDQFTSFECASNTVWAGLMIPRVRIEVDEASVFVPQRRGEPLGALVRHGTTLSIVSKGDWSSPHRHVIVVSGLQPAEADQEAGFLRWQVVLGEGSEKRVLHKMDVSVERR